MFKTSFDGLKNHDTALLLVTFGSTHQEAHDTFHKIASQFAQRFPDTDLYMAFTSKICMKRWFEKTGEQFHPASTLLDQLAGAGYSHINIQSLHVIPGEEYKMVKEKMLTEFRLTHPGVEVVMGAPLMDSDEDIKLLGDTLLRLYLQRLEQGELLVLMGHGNDKSKFRDANQKYLDLQNYFNTLTDRIYIGTVDFEEMTIDHLLEVFAGKYPRGTVINLLPLMSIAGDHAKNDMAGAYDPDEADEDQSWRVRLQKAGFVIEDENCRLRGLADEPEIVDIWIKHLQQVL
ncbi:sirohydrochlorin cobaltochelatase [Porphyromonas pogonae]|uniref:sirohydrochlorin cobaltochelatase n=1 Tax=Porphyromonas pogonae TaxID=867595 RepID=UPI002E78EDE5|nr:sirohydrochlorin cobaltochelatase [Porphyromonas pogonae]